MDNTEEVEVIIPIASSYKKLDYSLRSSALFKE